MKKQFVVLAIAAVLSIGGVFAQGGGQGMQRQTPEERTKATMEKLAPLNLNADQTTKTTAVFTSFYNDQQKAMEDMRASGSMDREAMKAKRDELTAKRNTALQAILTPDQYKKFTDELEPAMRPKPRQQQ